MFTSLFIRPQSSYWLRCQHKISIFNLIQEILPKQLQCLRSNCQIIQVKVLNKLKSIENEISYGHRSSFYYQFYTEFLFGYLYGKCNLGRPNKFKNFTKDFTKSCFNYTIIAKGRWAYSYESTTGRCRRKRFFTPDKPGRFTFPAVFRRIHSLRNNMRVVHDPEFENIGILNGVQGCTPTNLGFSYSYI